MRGHGLQSPVRRRRRNNSFRGEVGKTADNVLNRQFQTAVKHTKWATDVTSSRWVPPRFTSQRSLISMTIGSSLSWQVHVRASRWSPMAFALRSAASLRTSDPWSIQIRGFSTGIRSGRTRSAKPDSLNQCPVRAPAWITPPWNRILQRPIQKGTTQRRNHGHHGRGQVFGGGMESYLQSPTAPRIPERHDTETLLGKLDARKPISYRINAGLLTGGPVNRI